MMLLQVLCDGMDANALLTGIEFAVGRVGQVLAGLLMNAQHIESSVQQGCPR